MMAEFKENPWKVVPRVPPPPRDKLTSELGLDGNHQMAPLVAGPRMDATAAENVVGALRAAGTVLQLGREGGVLDFGG